MSEGDVGDLKNLPVEKPFALADGATAAASAKEGSARERIALSRAAFERIDGWLVQLTNHSAAIAVKRKDLVDWIICSHAPALSTAELRDLGLRFFDEERVLKMALLKLKEAKRRGESLDMKSVLRSLGSAQAAAKKTVDPAQDGDTKVTAISKQKRSPKLADSAYENEDKNAPNVEQKNSPIS